MIIWIIIDDDSLTTNQSFRLQNVSNIDWAENKSVYDNVNLVTMLKKNAKK